MTSIMEKAHTLANAIQESEELINMRNTEAAMAGDAEAQKILQEYQEARQKIEYKQASGAELTEAEQSGMEEIEKK